MEKEKPKQLSKRIVEFISTKRRHPPMRASRRLILVGITAALSNLLSYPPIAIPLVIGPWFESAIHFSQLPIILCGVLAGPIAGLITGAVGGLFMAATKIPFIVGGLAIFGCAVGFFGKKLRPSLAGTLAWCVQAPYVLVTDYVWFTLFVPSPSWVAWTIVSTIMIKLTIEAIICSILAEIVARRLP